MEFKYKAIKSKGEIVKGIISADNETKAMAQLKKQNLTPVSLKPVKPLFSRTARIKTSELILFTRLFARLIRSHVPVINSLNIIRSTIKDRKFITIISAVRNDLSAGRSLSQALKKFPGVFSDFYVSAIEAGEDSAK
ncbi:MAG: type II secretion system F family protein, partial [bacterium]|nr:type II secretion system F family protein [bacterium]